MGKTVQWLRQRGGLSAIYFIFLLVALAGFVSMAVDIGRIRLARTQIQLATDAAARAGADSLPISQQATIDNTVTSADANDVIDMDQSKNNVIGARTNPGLPLEPSEDIEVGIWNPTLRTFTVLTDTAKTPSDERRKANAVHVTGRRIKARDNPIPLIFATVVGVFSSDIEREAIAYVTGGADKFGLVELDSVKALGNAAAIDSVSLPSNTRRGNGWVGSNGNIDLGNGDVYGDARPGAGKAILQGPNSYVSGWQATLSDPLKYPVDAYSAPGANNNAAITPTSAVSGTKFAPTGSIDVTIPANGKYVFSSWTANNGTTTITAPADIYINGDFKMAGTGTLKIVAAGTNKVRFFVNGNFTQSGGNIVNASKIPGNLYISVTKPGTSVSLKGTVPTYAHIYAPLSAASENGTGDFYGWMIGKTLSYIGGAKLHYDESRNDNKPHRVTLVR